MDFEFLFVYLFLLVNVNFKCSSIIFILIFLNLNKFVSWIMMESKTSQPELDPHSVVIPKEDKLKFEDLSGLEEQKTVLKEIILLPIKFPQLFSGYRRPGQGILLFGVICS